MASIPPVRDADYRAFRADEFTKTASRDLGVLEWADQAESELDALEEMDAREEAAYRETTRAPAGPPAGPPVSPAGGARPPAPTSSGAEQHRGAIEAAFGDLGPETVDNFVRIVDKESGGRVDARKNDEIEDSVGIGQVNQRVHPQLAAKYDLRDPVQNARAMREIYDQQGYGAWKNASTSLGLLGTGGRAPAAESGPQTTARGDWYAQAADDLDRLEAASDRPPSTYEQPASAGSPSSPRDLAPDQFGSGLSTEDAYAACGPAAAVAFARANGRNPTLAEARDLAREFGWTPSSGMAGPKSQLALMQALVPDAAVRLEENPDAEAVAQDAASGNVVTLSTRAHYYTVSGYDPDSGRLYVGVTGRNRKGGSEWMSLSEIRRLDGPVAALFVDSPLAPAPSVAVDDEGGTWLDKATRELDRLEAGAVNDKATTGQPDAVVQGASVGGSFADEQADPMNAPAIRRMTDKVDALPSPALAVPQLLGQEVERAADVVEPMVDQATADRRAILDESRRLREKQQRGEPITAEDADRMLDLVEPIALSLTGEPLKIARGAAAAARGAATVDAAGQPGMSLEVTGGPIPSITTKAKAAEVARLRLDKFPEAVRDTIEQAATEGDFWRTQRRGVIPDADAEKMADDLGRSVDDLIKTGKAGRSYSTEETRALRNAVVSQAMTVNELVAEIARAPHEATPGLVARSVAEGMKLADLTRIAEGARAEAGRTFRAYQGFARDYAASPAGAVERIFKAVGGGEEATKAVAEYHKMIAQGASPAQLAQFWARAEAPPVGVTDWWELLRRNAMLSGPRTLVINALSGASEIPWKLAGDALESTLRGRPGEIVPEVRAIWAGLVRGSDNALQTLSHGITDEAAKAGEMPRDISSRMDNPVAKRVAQALEAPMRAQQATDDVVSGIAYAMHVARSAAQTASREKLSGAAWNERVADLIASPTPEMMQWAKSGADEMTFKGEMGRLGTAVGQFQKVPFIGPAVIPFLRTVYHITSRGIDRSPLGFVGIGIDLARGVYKEGAELPKATRSLGARTRDAAMGSAASVWFYDQALRGNVTGAGPDDPEKRAMLQAQGWQPYAVKIGDDYVGYQNWGPVAVPLALMAGAAEAQTYAKPGTSAPGMVGDALQRSVKVLTEQNYLQGIGAIYKSMTDFERYGHQWLNQYLSSLVPYGAAINTVGQATDPLVRQPEKGNVGQALAARVPGLRESLPAKQDVLGRDVVNEQQGLAAAWPLRTTEGRPDETLTVLLANGADIPAPPKEIRGVPLTPEEQRRHQELAGPLIAEGVGRAIGSARFDTLAPEIRKKMLSGVIESSRERAAGQLFKELGADEIRRRLREKQAAGATR